MEVTPITTSLPDEMAFTVTNNGSFGSVFFTYGSGEFTVPLGQPDGAPAFQPFNITTSSSDPDDPSNQWWYTGPLPGWTDE